MNSFTKEDRVDMREFCVAAALELHKTQNVFGQIAVCATQDCVLNDAKKIYEFLIEGTAEASITDLENRKKR